MSLLSFNFVIIYIICIMLVMLKYHLSYFKDSIFKCFFMEYNRLIYLFIYLFIFYFFSQHIMVENPRPEEENIIKDIRNLFRPGKETKAIKDIGNLFLHEEEKLLL